ncbi:hypothetical protein [Halopseudomonas sp.]|uniref:hypothetical protein n=1 Tax=Halopseudomonas sp. TaxID=2901191 RepID=UPI0030031881|tara:strand:+ start:7697 stop:8806 length:1110 start_codon:yes stop_codon:yes gene_type:complete
MSDSAIPLGERDGQMFRAYEVENGLRCGCVCPGCRKPLVAANQGQKRFPYFRHEELEGCANGRAEGVRRAAVQVIAQRGKLLLPGFSDAATFVAESGRVFTRDICFDPVEVQADEVERFVDLEDLRAHALILSKDRQLVVRIKVTARQEHERNKRLRAMNFSSIEIDLHHLSDAEINDAVIFDQAVLCDLINRKWIRSLRGDLLTQRALAALELDAAKADQEWALAEAERLAAEEASVREEEAHRKQMVEALSAHRATQRAMAANYTACWSPGLDSVGALQQREGAIVTTMQKAVREWNGRGAECTACRLVNPPSSSFCFYCTSDKSQLRAMHYPQDLGKTIVNRMRCSAAPAQSLRTVPTLLLGPDIF